MVFINVLIVRGFEAFLAIRSATTSLIRASWFLSTAFDGEAFAGSGFLGWLGEVFGGFGVAAF
ncbi:hypothetical protein MDS_2612 [Ectopseudomonas mendocina NK-01]|nr:hypothetical protein MDS_2612 [Pseudomonas mendocina NK-01]